MQFITLGQELKLMNVILETTAVFKATIINIYIKNLSISPSWFSVLMAISYCYKLSMYSDLRDLL